MELTRRHFLQTAGAAAVAGAVAGLAATAPQEAEAAPATEEMHTTKHVSVCPGCSAGCGVVCTVADSGVVAVAGDGDHPLNRGALCTRGAALADALTVVDKAGACQPNPARVTEPRVRRPGKDEWEPIAWDDALNEIADWIKSTRDNTFLEKDGKVTVNRCEGLASFGGARLSAEEQYVLSKALRSWGITRIDSEASLDRAASAWAAAATVGEYSVESPLSDCANAQAVLTIGVDAALNPALLPWINRAQEAGAPWIAVDTHFNASAEMADYYVAIRPGTATAFLCGLANYLIQQNLWQPEYVINFTNASYILKENFGFDSETGLFSEWDAEAGSYAADQWGYAIKRTDTWDERDGGSRGWVRDKGVPAWKVPDVPVAERDVTLRNPLSVWQQLANHLSRYDTNTVADICGAEASRLEEVWAAYAVTGAPEVAGSLVYGEGLTATDTATQSCRAALLVQLLLGNLGMAGGGVHDMGGLVNSQGALDMGLVPGWLPGYLPVPTASTDSLKTWLEQCTAADGFGTDFAKAAVSLLKEWWGKAAKGSNDFGFDWLPRAARSQTLGVLPTLAAMEEGSVKGWFVWDANPARIVPGGAALRRCLAALDFLVVSDIAETETAAFWRAKEATPSAINTTVYLLPSAVPWEKDGTWVNSARWLQYGPQAATAPGEARSAGDVIDQLWMRVAERYRADGGAFADPVLKAQWGYHTDRGFCPRKVSWALNGYLPASTNFDDDTVKLLRQSSEIAANGKTACGALIYCGSWNNIAGASDYSQQPVARREDDDAAGLLIFDHWGFSWPNNVRIPCNRSSCGLAGNPWNAAKAVVQWDGSHWVQYDAADFPAGGTGERVIPNNKAFPGVWEQAARLLSFDVPSGPLPEFYEAVESPVRTALNGALSCPVTVNGPAGAAAPAADGTAAIGATVRAGGLEGSGFGEERLSEPLALTVPEAYVELPMELASAHGIANGDTVVVTSARGQLQARAWTTARLKPFAVGEAYTSYVNVVAPYGWNGPVVQGTGGEDLALAVGDGCTGAPGWQTVAVSIKKA